MNDRRKIAVIGGGPAGMMAAVTAAAGADVTLFERNEKLGKKLYITGKGRCNITNCCSIEEFFSQVIRGGKFLYSALNAFSPADTMEFVEDNGCPLKIERGGRVFPVSDKSSDVLKAFGRALSRCNADIRLNTFVPADGIVALSDGSFEILGERFDRLIYAGGGASYKATGSTGEGLKFARDHGHNIIELVPSLINVDVFEDVSQLQGLSLKNVMLSAFDRNKCVYSEMGEMLFTDKGVSGPLVLSASGYINRLDLSKVTLSIDLKPALSKDMLIDRIKRDFVRFKTKQLKNSLSDLLPASLIPYIIMRAELDPQMQVDHFSAGMYERLCNTLKGLTFSVSGLGSLERAIVTSGGVDLKEVNPKTMESKLIKGLFFAGEMLDADAFTGGFNIQIALSTGFCAGRAAADLE